MIYTSLCLHEEKEKMHLKTKQNISATFYEQSTPKRA